VTGHLHAKGSGRTEQTLRNTLISLRGRSRSGLDRTCLIEPVSSERKRMSQPLSRTLSELENESIHILREVAAAFSNPVLLYSIGKDSSVLLHLARKAFYPATLPLKVLHIDTGWKFREMITFRDSIAAK